MTVFGQEKRGIRQRMDESRGDVTGYAFQFCRVAFSSFSQPWTRNMSYPLTLKRSEFI